MALRAAGGLVVLTQDGLEHLDFATGRLDPIADPEADIPDNRFNDAKCDRAGRLWAGTTRLDSSPGRGALYRFDQSGFARMTSGLTVSNGLDWSPDDTRFYFADFAESRVYVYDFDPAQGTIHNRRVLIETRPEDGRPDGLTVDAEGGIWCAMWDGWAIRRYTPDGSSTPSSASRSPAPRAAPSAATT